MGNVAQSGCTFGGGARYVAAVLVLVAVNMALCGSVCVMKYVFFF